ncbi:MAG: helix-turn-helix transcriptional regulator [Telluria sp.]
MANQVLRPQASAGRLGIKISTFYDHISRGILPATIKFGPRAVGHPSSEIEAIMNARTAGQSEDEIKQLVLDLTAARQRPN